MRPSIFILYTLSGLTSFVTKVASTVPTDFATTFQEAQEDTFGFATVAQSVDRPRVVPNSYIAEFVRPETTDDKGIEHILSSVLSSFESLFGEVTHSLTFDSPIFYGASFRISNPKHGPEQIKQLGADHPNVVSIRENRLYYPTEARNRKRGPKRQEPSVRDNGGGDYRSRSPSASGGHHDASDTISQDRWGITRLTGVKQQHDLGNYGQGVHICTGDTGVDAGHPGLNRGRPIGQECIGPGCPIINGIDFVGDNWDGKKYVEGPLKSSSVRNHPDCFHGTYTAGHILSNDTELGILGSAPGASASVYQIAACTVADGVDPDLAGSASDEILLKSYVQTAKDGCSIFSLSFGGSSSWAATEDPGPLSRLWDQGILPVLSAGNDGGEGAYSTNCGGCSSKVIAVGSSNLLDTPGWHAAVDPPLPKSQSLLLATAYSPVVNATYAKNNLPLWFTPAALKDPNVTSDGCEPITQDLTGKVAVLFRGGCSLDTKVRGAINASAQHVLIINEVGRDLVYLPQPDSGFTAMLTHDQGLELYNHFKSTTRNVKVSFGEHHDFKLTLQPNTMNAGIVSGYSSWGPDWDGVIKPDITAPGGLLPSLSVLPYRYRITSGTSGSTPFFAGAAALFRKAKGVYKSPPEVIRRAFLHTAQPLPTAMNNSRPMSVFKQGHGLMNLTAALALTSKAEPLKIFTGDTPRANLTHTIQVTNEGTVAQDYTARHLPAQSFLAVQARNADGHYKDPTVGAFLLTPEPTDASAGSVTVNPSTFTLAPGASTQVTVTVAPPAPSDRINLYSGWVFFDAKTPDGTFSVPYAGIAGDLGSIPTFVNEFKVFNTTTPALYNSSLTEQVRNDTTRYTLKDDDYPTLVWQQQVGTPYLQCDLVPANISYKATTPIIDDPECCTAALPGAMHGREIDEVPIVGQLLNFTHAARDYADTVTQCSATQITDPKTRELVDIPRGKYRILLRVQRLFATAFKTGEYDSYLSHAFEVL